MNSIVTVSPPLTGACEVTDGVRLCGGSNACPALSAPTCEGFGCTPVHDVLSTGATSGAGICWADLPDYGRDSCSICDDGSVCLQRSPNKLVCVSPHVCEALWDDGARDVCRYADKERYDHRPFPVSDQACPLDPAQKIACGGSCGPCRDGLRCIGRSPDHPFGICSIRFPNSNLGYGPCTIVMGAASPLWCDPFNPDSTDVACAAFRVPDADQGAALEYGLCTERSACVALSASYPGGLDCYDGRGQRLNP